MNTKKLLQIFLGSWAMLIFLTVLTDAGEELTPGAQVVCTGVLAALITLLVMLATRGEKKKCFEIHDARSGELLYRVEGEWIYKGREEKASWYLKRGAVYSFENMTPVCRFKDGAITREGDGAPAMRVEGDRIIACATGEVIYQIRE